MNIDVISLIVLGGILCCALVARRWLQADPLKPALVGTIASLIATAIAAVCYVAIDLGEVALNSILFSPIFEGAVFGALAAIGLEFMRARVGRATFMTMVTFTGAGIAWIVGELFVGHSPHYSRERAIAFLVVSWTVVALSTAIAVQYAFHRTRARVAQLHR